MTDDLTPDNVRQCMADALAACDAIQDTISQHPDKNQLLWTTIEYRDTDSELSWVTCLRYAANEHPEYAHLLGNERFVHCALTLLDQLSQLAAQRPACDHGHDIFGFGPKETDGAYDDDLIDDKVTMLCCNDREGALLDELSNDDRRTHCFTNMTYMLTDVLTA